MPPATPSDSFDTPTISASDAAFNAHATTRIAAPASLVFRTLRNTDTWRDWNPWVPRVVITYQTPDEDTATAEEISELVRNTSIAGSYDSDLTDGVVGGTIKSRNSEDEKPPATPPLKLRSKSNASNLSGARSSSVASEASGHPTSPPLLTVPESPHANGAQGGGLSAAQKYAAAQESRRSSVKSGDPLPPVSGNTLTTDPFLSPSTASYHEARRRSYQEKTRARNTAMLLKLYGEPSVRIQLNTKMTFFVRMNPKSRDDMSQQHVVVTHVSRPHDPATDVVDLGAINPLQRSKTHTLSDSPEPVYRIVWKVDNSKSSLTSIKNGSAYPKSLLQIERVHEIRPIITESGAEECEYRHWELQKGPMAKINKKKHESYIQVMLERWGTGLGQFCEGMGGKVDRRDFSVDLSEAREAVI